MYIGSTRASWCNRIKYLVCHFKCSRGEVDPSCFLGRFYGAFNNIVNVIGSRRDEMLSVHLVKTYCLPSLLYGCETWHLNNADTKSIDIAWNNAFRKIFNGYWRESVNPLQFYCQCLPVSLVIAMRKILFWKKMFYHNNPVLHILANECYRSVKAVADVYNIKPHQIASSSSFAIRNLFWSYFTTMMVNVN